MPHVRFPTKILINRCYFDPYNQRN